MKQVVEDMKNGEVRVVESPTPLCGAGEVLVRNAASLISPGTEKLLIEMGKKSLVGKALARTDLVALAYEKAKREGFVSVFREAMARLDQPLPLGYSSAGVVLQAGRDAAGFAPGDRVACAGFAFASHAEIIAVPRELCVKLPEIGSSGSPTSFEDASFVMLGGIALHGYRSARLTSGESLAVVGLGLIGLLTIQIAKAYGLRTIGVDINPEKARLAESLGCETALVIGKDDIESAVLQATDGAGADAVILTAATSDNSPVLLAEKIARRRGKIVLVGVSDLSLTRKAFWDKELSFTVSRASGVSTEGRGSQYAPPVDVERWTESRNLQEFIRLLGTGAVRVKELITHRVPVAEAPAAYDMILSGSSPFIGVVLQYPGEAAPERVVGLAGAPAQRDSNEPAAHRTRLGVIGAGMFTKNILLPVLKRSGTPTFVGIAAKSGLNSGHVGRSFGFQYATTEYRRLLDDKNVGAIVITTRHDLHAGMVADALRAGKHVFVEKPLAISEPQLHECAELLRELPADRMFMVGFNRRYAPLARLLKDSLGRRTAPLQVVYRVNAGYVPPDHWTQQPDVGGGRIIGEACHMIDLAQYLVSSDPVEVLAKSIRPSGGQFASGDNVSLEVSFADGSLATVIYTAMGSKAFSRERIEVFGGGYVGLLEDFRSLEIIRGTRRTRKRLMSQDMGYADEMRAFLEESPAQGRDNLRRAILTTRTTLCAEESLRTGASVRVPGAEGIQ